MFIGAPAIFPGMMFREIFPELLPDFGIPTQT
jgi:hypothetical protein